MRGKLLIRGGIVLSLDRAVGNALEADVLIDDGLIAEVGTNLRARHVDVVDASDAIVMPGFVDAHRRVWQSLLRNLAPDAAAHAAHRYTADDVYAATLVGLLQAVEAGITTVVDMCDVSDDVDHLAAAISAHADAGVGGVLVTAVASESGERRLTCPPGLTLAAASPPITGDLDQLGERWALARRNGHRIHAAAGTTERSTGQVAELGRRRVLGADVTLFGAHRLTDADFDAIAATSTALVLTPASAMAGGWGPPPMQQLLDRNIRPGLGVGDECLAPGDVLAQMRSVISVQHATSFDLKLAGKGGVPKLLTTRDAIRYGTVDGAHAVGLGSVTGTLTPGKRADVLVLRTDRPNIAPVNDPIGAVVWGMDTSNVDWVFVGGEPRVANGVLVGDVARARILAGDAQRRVTAASGLDAVAGATA